MTMTYRTAGAWGPGKGANLTAGEVDVNFHGLATRLSAVETNPAQPAQIEAITSSGSALTVIMDNGDVYGPLAVPAVALRFMGNWAPNTSYLKNDIVRSGNDVFFIAADHTSGPGFLPGQAIGGVTVYQLMFDGGAAARSSVGPVFDNDTHAGISYVHDPVSGDISSTVDFASGRTEYFNAVRDFLYFGSHTGISFAYDFANAQLSATVDITQYTDELAQDAVAAALSAGTHSGISFTYDDVANSLSAAVSQIAFTGLSDVPTSYAGHAGKLVTVRTDGTGLQFTSPGTLLPVAATPRFMGAQVYMSASTGALNIMAGYAVPFNSEAFDTDGFHDTVTNNTRLTIPAGLGIRRVKLHASVRFSSIATGSDNYVSIRKNGSEVYYGSGSIDAENSGTTSQILNAATSVVSVVEGDWFELFLRTSDTSIIIEADRTVLTLEVIEVEGGINIANVQIDASPARTLVMADINACLLLASANPTTVTVPANGSVAFPIGAAIELEQRGTGQVSIVGDVGVTVNKPIARLAATAGQYSVVRLRKTGTNTWTLSGDMA